MESNSINHKITQSLERIAKVFRVLLWEEAKKYQLSPIQIQILVYCLSHKPEMLKVGLFAKEFDLTKATVSDSIRVLIEKELLKKIPDTYDSRSFTVQLTTKGKKIANKMSGFSKPLELAIGSISEKEKEAMLENLLNIIHNLNQNDVISTQRMCLTCQHYSVRKSNHFCGLLNKVLHKADLQIDCSDHSIQ